MVEEIIERMGVNESLDMEDLWVKEFVLDLTILHPTRKKWPNKHFLPGVDWANL